jgi:drug/metabolite transporter (DMT)-like permease
MMAPGPRFFGVQNRAPAASKTCECVSPNTQMAFFKHLAINGFLMAVLAHGLVGISLVWDKVLLNRPMTKNLASYVFWLGAISVFGLILIPFGFHWPPLMWAGVGFAAGLLDLIASFFYYWALKAGEASDELAAMGGFAPVATALIAIPLLNKPIGGQLLGFALMTLGGFIMFFAEKRPLRTMLPKIVLAASGFGLMNVLQKLVFDHTNFVTGFVFVTLGTTVGALMMLIPPRWRHEIFEYSEEAPPRSKWGYMANRFTAGVGSFLGVYAVSLTNPALVEAVSGLRYVIVFIGAYAITRFRPSWFQEDFHLRVLIAKVTATALVVAGLVATALRGGQNAGGPQ